MGEPNKSPTPFESPSREDKYPCLDLAHIVVGYIIFVTVSTPGEDYTQEPQQLYQLRKVDDTRGPLSGWSVVRKSYDGVEMREPNCQLYLPDESEEAPLDQNVMKRGVDLQIMTGQDGEDSNVSILGQIVAIQVAPSRRLIDPPVSDSVTQAA